MNTNIAPSPPHPDYEKLLERTMYLSVSKLVCAVTLFILSTALQAADWNTNKAGVVLDGYHVVAYRTQDQAVKGRPELRSTHDGVSFDFSSAANKTLFDANPGLYLPKFNGYCAFAVGAKNARVPANPDSFKMYNGELLVFFNDDYEGQKFNTKLPWNNDEAKLALQAEKNWPRLGQ